MSDLISLRELTLAQTEEFCASLGLPRFRASQIFSWVHARGVTSLEEMTNLSKELRLTLAEKVSLAPLKIDAEQQAEDGTRKLRLCCADGALIETVLIPEQGKITQCVSTQVGCALGCTFCSTATMGFKRNLTAGEIVDQVYRGRALLDDYHRLTNLVFMGMGEPLNNLQAVLTAVEILCAEHGANFSPRRITISTAGVVPQITELGRLNRSVGLAISLNATTDELRSQLMPINKRYPLAQLFAALRAFPLPRRRRITFEYIVLGGLNHSAADVKRMAQLLNGLPAKINLIPFNAGRRDCDLRPPTDDELETFAEQLRDKDLPTYVRKSRGQEIAAACGQLATAK